MPIPSEHNKLIALKALIETRVVKSYLHIFKQKYLNSADMRTITGRNHYAVKKRMTNPLELTVGDIVKLAKAIGIDSGLMKDIVWNDVKKIIRKK